MTTQTIIVTLIITLLSSLYPPRLLWQAVESPLQECQGTSAVQTNSEVWAALEAIVELEVQARKTADWQAFQSLLHPETSGDWQQQQNLLFDSALTDSYVTRVVRNGNWALAAVIETRVTDGSEVAQFYTTRTFRWSEAGDWQLTSPSLEPWGEECTLNVKGIQLKYRAFDEPYVRAIAPRIELILPRIAADFGITGTETGLFQVQMSPLPTSTDLPFSPDAKQLTVPSPLAPGFLLGISQSPEEFLLGYLSDSLGIALLKRAYGEKAEEPGRFALAHTAVQWEVEQAVQHDFTSRFATEVTGKATSLSSLLDPKVADPTGNRSAEQHLFLRFAIAEYGRETIAPFLEAVFETNTADELIRSAFGRERNNVEKQWRKWLSRQVSEES